MSASSFDPNYRNLLHVLYNRKPERLPLYEHHINIGFISKFRGEKINVEGNKPKDYREYYRKVISFWQEMTYDAFDFEAPVCECYPGHGAIFGGRGPIQSRADFERYPFDEVSHIFWERHMPHFEAITAVLPEGMKAYGGCGYGIFESCQDLVGFESLCLIQNDDPELFSDLVNRIGDLYVQLWSDLVKNYGDAFVFYRMGDDLGFKTSTLLAPNVIREHLFPQYKRIIEVVHRSGKKFLLHSCGNIFTIMEGLIEIGIDAKHSNEDEIAPFEKWIELYNKRIGLFGGIDMNVLCNNGYEDVFNIVLERGIKYRNFTKGYGIGTGNSIPDYIPVEGFLGMVDAVKEIRKRELRNS